MRVAVIDLGTNTFNLLIADISNENKQFVKIHNSKIASKLGRGGINNRTLTPEAFERGLQALTEQKQIINSHNCEKIYAIATSAIRNADNGSEFVDAVQRKLGFAIQVISGNEEAELIYKGNRLATELNSIAVILDIGGGSNEFIIADKNKVYWKQSFEIGVQRLLQLFTPSTPLTTDEYTAICTYVDSHLQPLYDAIAKYPTHTLIGSSGSFDTFRNLIESEDEQDYFSTSSFDIPIETFTKLHNTLISSTTDQLSQLKGIDLARIEFLPTASSFVNFITKKLQITHIIQSAYSLKEGVISQLMED